MSFSMPEKRVCSPFHLFVFFILLTLEKISIFPNLFFTDIHNGISETVESLKNKNLKV